MVSRRGRGEIELRITRKDRGGGGGDLWSRRTIEPGERGTPHKSEKGERTGRGGGKKTRQSTRVLRTGEKGGGRKERQERKGIRGGRLNWTCKMGRTRRWILTYAGL